MRVSIVVPAYRYNWQYPCLLSLAHFPVGLAYIAAALKAAGHDVLACNLNNRFGFPDAKTMLTSTLRRHLVAEKPDIVLTGGICTEFACIRDILEEVRHHDLRVVLGGGIATHDAEVVMELLRPDYLLLGEADETVTKLMAAIPSGKLADVPNTVYRNGGQMKATNRDLRGPDVNKLPLPEYDIFDADQMLDNSVTTPAMYRFGQADPRTWVVVAARGCPFRCTFCVHGKQAAAYRERNIGAVMAELEHFYEKYQFNNLQVLDELFAINRDRLLEWIDAIADFQRRIGRKLSWFFQTHARAGLTEGDLRMAKAAGCYAFSYGVESLSPRVLQSMNKRTRPEQIEGAVSASRAVGIGFCGLLIFGDTAETPDTIRETFDFVGKHYAGLHSATLPVLVYPGSALYDRCREDGTIPDAAAYYKQIDERRYHTAKAFPRLPWMLWAGMISFLGFKGLWQPAAPATVRARLKRMHFDILVLNARCPWCSSVFEYRHAIPHETKEYAALAVTKNTVLNKVLRYKDRPWFIRLLVLFSKILSIPFPWFKHIGTLVRRDAQTDNCAVTGCLNCNQAVLVEYQP